MTPQGAPEQRWTALPLPVGTFIGVLIALVAVSGVAIGSWQALQSQREAATSVTHTLEVIRQIDIILAAATDAETGQRGFLLTGEERYLAFHNSVRGAMPGYLQRLRGHGVGQRGPTLAPRVARAADQRKARRPRKHHHAAPEGRPARRRRRRPDRSRPRSNGRDSGDDDGDDGGRAGPARDSPGRLGPRANDHGTGLDRRLAGPARADYRRRGRHVARLPAARVAGLAAFGTGPRLGAPAGRAAPRNPGRERVERRRRLSRRRGRHRLRCRGARALPACRRLWHSRRVGSRRRGRWRRPDRTGGEREPRPARHERARRLPAGDLGPRAGVPGGAPRRPRDASTASCTR